MKDRKSFKNSYNAMEQELSFQKGLQKNTKTKMEAKTKSETKRKTKTKNVPHMIYTISPQVMFGMVLAIMILSRRRGTYELCVCEKILKPSKF